MTGRKLAMEDGGFIKKDDTWYHRIGVTESGHPTKKPVEIVESGYTCRDGVWYKCVSVSES